MRELNEFQSFSENNGAQEFLQVQELNFSPELAKTNELNLFNETGLEPMQTENDDILEETEDTKREDKKNEQTENHTESSSASASSGSAASGSVAAGGAAAGASAAAAMAVQITTMAMAAVTVVTVSSVTSGGAFLPALSTAVAPYVESISEYIEQSTTSEITVENSQKNTETPSPPPAAEMPTAVPPPAPTVSPPVPTTPPAVITAEIKPKPLIVTPPSKPPAVVPPTVAPPIVSPIPPTDSGDESDGGYQPPPSGGVHTHVFDHVTPIETVPATCLINGYQKFACTYSGCTEVETVALNAVGHHTVAGGDTGTIITPATCFAIGKTQYACSVCAELFQLDTAKLVHNFSGSTHNAINSADPSNTHLAYCILCDNETAVENHTWGVGNIKTAATCIDAGEEEFTCTASGCIGKKSNVLPATGIHDYTGIAAAQLDDIKHTKTCNTCHVQHKFSHNWSGGVCADCGMTQPDPVVLDIVSGNTLTDNNVGGLNGMISYTPTTLDELTYIAVASVIQDGVTVKGDASISGGNCMFAVAQKNGISTLEIKIIHVEYPDEPVAVKTFTVTYTTGSASAAVS